MADDDHRPRHLARSSPNRRRGKGPEDGAQPGRTRSRDDDRANPRGADGNGDRDADWWATAPGAPGDSTAETPSGDGARPWWARADDAGSGGAYSTPYPVSGDGRRERGAEAQPVDGRRGAGSGAAAGWWVDAGQDRQPGGGRAGHRAADGVAEPGAGGSDVGRWAPGLGDGRARWVAGEGSPDGDGGATAPSRPVVEGGNGGNGHPGGKGPNGGRERERGSGGPRAGSDGGDGPGEPERGVAGGEGDGPPPVRPERRLPGWLVPALLGAGAVVAGLGAVLLDQHETAQPVEPAATPVTPVLAARRVPEVLAVPVADRRLTADLQSWVAQSPPDTCLVVESGDRSLYAHNPAAPLAGASTQKIVTSAALLLALGPDARLETVVSAGAAPSGGVVAGDLYVVGGGDPLLTSPGFAARLAHDPTLAVDPMRLVDAIVEAGITRIDGSVVGDGTRYDGERYHPTWPDRFQQRELGPVGALTINDGMAGADGQSQPPAAASGADPAANAATVITDLLRQRGVTVVGAPRSGPAPGGLTEVATFPSPTVREMVAEMLTDSDDTTAEMALKEVGLTEGGAGTWEAGAAAAAALLQEAGVPLDGVQIVEGSGLSTANRLTCQLLVDLLTLPEAGPVLVEGLAVAGETGTLQDRWAGTPVAGRLVGKTGTLNTVTALSGRVSPLQGGALTFAYVANVPEGQVLGYEDVALQDTLGEILVNYPRDVDVATLVPAPPTTGAAAPPSGG